MHRILATFAVFLVTTVVFGCGRSGDVQVKLSPEQEAAKKKEMEDQQRKAMEEQMKKIGRPVPKEAPSESAKP